MSAAVAGALVLASAAVPLSGCSACTPAKTATVQVPPVTARPQQVVRAYLDSVMARDLDTAEVLSTPDFAENQQSVADSPFCNWRKLENVRISEPAPADYDQETYRYSVHVFVDFTLTQREAQSMADGPVVWGYVLVRNSPAERWRIADAGVG